jgi:hypothetical protein
MAIPAMIRPAPALRDGEDSAGVEAAAALGVEDSALGEALAEGSDRPANRRGTLG